MNVFTLKRIAETDKATYGVLLHKGSPFCLTLELPWKENRKNESCIPKGRYAVTLRYSPSFKYITPILHGVPDREYVLIHKGNEPAHTKGCILVGEQFEEGGIRHSGEAFTELLGLMGIDTCQLEVK